MSQPTSSHAALLVPEILATIAQHLSRKDFLSAVLVLKSWHANLIPLLWHTLELPQRWRLMMMADHDSSPSGFPDPSIFKTYAHLVRSLSCNYIQYHLHYLVPYCCHLTELGVVDLSMDALPLMRINTGTLTSIKFKRKHELPKTPFKMHEFLQVMNECLFLDHLRLVDFEIEEREDPLGSSISSRDRYRRRTGISHTTPTGGEGEGSARTEEEILASITLFYEIILRLSTLELCKNVIRTPPLDRSQVFYRLRKLSLLECTTMSYRDQLQLVSQCQYLTHLKLQFDRGGGGGGGGGDSEQLDLEELATIELNVTCPHITHLDLSESTLKDQEIAALLEYLPRLTSFRAQRTNVGEKTIQMLTGLQSKVKDQLWELDLVDAREMKSEWIQQLLCSCSGLRQFRATKMNAQEIVNAALSSSSSSSSSSSTSGSWVCLQLLELQVSIIGIEPHSPPQVQFIIYDQLSKLTQLQNLILGGTSMSTWFRKETLELSLQNGFDRLDTLKELRMFNFRL
ncbi:hypothetical protein BGZ65_003449 [Modicella reniformis]|uniref:F-box domain-containing protein n=1 Tax=Modicella reniformis TaxID=1440133 RepID=A0A9P6MM02_9FUNG|nr:hypothetical protein BGZ65_003449 [Modicella reniformis]